MQSINRRQFIKIAGGLTAGAALSGCGSTLIPPFEPELTAWPTPASDTEWRALNRITFGPRPEERRRVTEIGLAAFIEEQLAPNTLPDMSLRPQLTLRRLESLHLDAPDLFDVEEDPIKQELQQGTLLGAVYSSAQLYEIMVDFWSNHFNIDQNKNECAWLKSVDDRDVIRPYALGNFYDLLNASAHSPAMLIYLDNQQNHTGNPNENYARELMELHSLGVDGGYTQRDVQQLARCLTGWTVKENFYRGQYTFDPDLHDDSAKQVFGLEIPAGAGQSGGEQVIKMLATHPATARFIATKLTRRFIADTPPPHLVEKAAKTFLTSHGDIKATLRTILLSPELLSPKSTPNTENLSLNLSLKLKRPFEFIASALRQLNAKTDGGEALLTYLSQMGQPLFQWPTPDGYPDTAAAWNGSLMTRWQFSLALANNNISGTSINVQHLIDTADANTRPQKLAQFSSLLLGQPLPVTVANQLLQSTPDNAVLLAALLGSPAFQWK